jgi:hypothetical protein
MKYDTDENTNQRTKISRRKHNILSNTNKRQGMSTKVLFNKIVRRCIMTMSAGLERLLQSYGTWKVLRDGLMKESSSGGGLTTVGIVLPVR